MNARERNANEEEGLTNEALERKEGEEGDAAVSGIFYLVLERTFRPKRRLKIE